MDSINAIKTRAQDFIRQNNPQDALQILEQARSTNPADAGYWQLLGSVHGMLGQLPMAEACAHRLVELRPDQAASHLFLGKVLSGLGHNSEAESAYRSAVELQPDNADAHAGLAAVLQQDPGRKQEALACYRKSTSLAPSNMDYLYNLGCLLNSMHQMEQAADAFRTVIKTQPGHAEAHFGLGMMLESQGELDKATRHYKAALQISPDLTGARRRLNMLSRTIPGWHFPMMNDEERNSAYNDALIKTVTPDSVVLDIGSGSGLLAMMAARAGAKHVYTCEVNRRIAEKAREIVAANGFADRITVIAKKSTDIEIGREIAERADILVSEILDECVLGEGVVPSVHHAREHLIKPDAVIIPSRATVYMALVEAPRLHEYYCVDKASGFDVSAFNEFSRAPYTILRLATYPYTFINDPVETFSFDLANPDSQGAAEKTFSLTADRDCTCHAIVYWFSLDLDDEISIDTSPVHDRSCWMQAAHVPNPAPKLKKGGGIDVLGKYDPVSVRFTLV